MPSTDCPIEFHLELTNERFQPYKWAVYERSTGNQLAYSENHTSRSGAVNAVHVVQAGRVSYSVFSSVDSDNVTWWYFHIKGLNGEIMARSSYKYRAKASAEAAKELVRLNAADAPFYDYTKAA